MATRAEKYPTTDTYTYYNANPKGRLTEDCVVRALSTALCKTYNDVLMELALVQAETGYAMTGRKGIEKYLEKSGWVKHAQPRKPDDKKYTGREWCKRTTELDPNGTVFGGMLCNIGGHHIVAVMPSKLPGERKLRYRVLDTWDSTGGCIGNYWTRG